MNPTPPQPSTHDSAAYHIFHGFPDVQGFKVHWFSLSAPVCGQTLCYKKKLAAIFAHEEEVDYYLDLKLVCVDFVIEVLPMWCSRLHLQCFAPVFWALTWRPAGCLMASDRQPLPPRGCTFPPNSLRTSQPSARSKRPTAQTHCSNHTEAGRARKPHKQHPHTHTHTHTHTHWLHARTHTQAHSYMLLDSLSIKSTDMHSNITWPEVCGRQEILAVRVYWTSLTCCSNCLRPSGSGVSWSVLGCRFVPKVTSKFLHSKLWKHCL